MIPTNSHVSYTIAPFNCIFEIMYRKLFKSIVLRIRYSAANFIECEERPPFYAFVAPCATVISTRTPVVCLLLTK